MYVCTYFCRGGRYCLTLTLTHLRSVINSSDSLYFDLHFLSLSPSLPPSLYTPHSLSFSLSLSHSGFLPSSLTQTKSTVVDGEFGLLSLFIFFTLVICTCGLYCAYIYISERVGGKYEVVGDEGEGVSLNGEKGREEKEKAAVEQMSMNGRECV